MAYKKRNTRKSYGTANRYGSKRSTRRSYSKKRRSTGRSRSQTVRIVVEQADPNPVGRPLLGQKAHTPRTRRF